MNYRVNCNGVYRDMTLEEIKEYEKMKNEYQPQKRSTEEIMADIEKLKQELQSIVDNHVDN